MLPSAVNGTEQRLDAVLEELRGLRAAVDALAPQPLQFSEPIEGVVELTEPKRRKAAKK